ncbi:MAG: A/G-specific adenine glycosylase [Candidatus Omnitrophica bacterium CG07_land_8_20_14_0_80_50_8]|nr:MAG: A/G-specific adenine glycosylase [Candidatus Omnitrophica bacterium CG07_land_8_20_14_0_80_50_8]
MTLQTKLLRWFHKNARPLPWRKRYRPYEVWVSEIMLQQTQVETALPYYKRWMKALPTIRSLAQSDEKKVLKLWEGLGYYSRARNIHESAKLIMKKYHGIFPKTYETILSLKGIGRYSAGAIASIAFNQERPIVDGNVLRVLSRVYAIKKPIDVEKNKSIFWDLEKKLIPKDQARYFNQALMELGALICKKENPHCGSCPIQSDCAAYRQARVEDYPVRKNKKNMVRVEAGALILSKNGKYLIQKRPVGKIMGGLWEFPEWKLARDKKLSANKIKNKTLENAEKEFCSDLTTQAHVSVIKRNYTNHYETLHVFSAELPSSTSEVTCKNGWSQAWISKKDFAKYPFSSAHAKIAQLISSR